MNTSLAKIGWKRMRKREIEIIVSFLSYLTRNRKFQKKRKKFKKLKNTIVSLFQAKRGRKRLRKRENKKLSFHSVVTRCAIENSKKMAKKFKKLKNTIMASFQAKIG